MPVRHGDPGDMVFPGGLRPGGLPAALPAPERLAAVRATGLLDTGPEGHHAAGEGLLGRPHP